MLFSQVKQQLDTHIVRRKALEANSRGIWREQGIIWYILLETENGGGAGSMKVMYFTHLFLKAEHTTGDEKMKLGSSQMCQFQLTGVKNFVD